MLFTFPSLLALLSVGIALSSPISGNHSTNIQARAARFPYGSTPVRGVSIGMSPLSETNID